MIAQLERAVHHKDLAGHQFYKKWVDGKISKNVLKEYAIAYLPITECIPVNMERLRGKGLDDLQLTKHAQDELEHVRLFKDFCFELGLTKKDLANDATRAIASKVTESLQRAVQKSPSAGVAAMYVYEVQLPKVMALKRKGLIQHYGFTDGPATEFFRVHAENEHEHIGFALQILEAMPPDPVALLQAREVLSAQWNMLNYFETLAA